MSGRAEKEKNHGEVGPGMRVTTLAIKLKGAHAAIFVYLELALSVWRAFYNLKVVKGCWHVVFDRHVVIRKVEVQMSEA